MSTVTNYEVKIPAWSEMTLTRGLESLDGFPCAVHYSTENSDARAYLQRIDEMTPDGQRIGEPEVVISTDADAVRFRATASEVGLIAKNLIEVAKALEIVEAAA